MGSYRGRLQELERNEKWEYKGYVIRATSDRSYVLLFDPADESKIIDKMPVKEPKIYLVRRAVEDMAYRVDKDIERGTLKNLNN